MAYRRKKSRGTKGLTCRRFRKVRVKGQGMARRCVKYSGRRTYRRKTTAARRRRRTTKRRATGMAKKGSHCKRFKRVRLRRKVGGRRYVRRCASSGR